MKLRNHLNTCTRPRRFFFAFTYASFRLIIASGFDVQIGDRDSRRPIYEEVDIHVFFLHISYVTNYNMFTYTISHLVTDSKTTSQKAEMWSSFDSVLTCETRVQKYITVSVIKNILCIPNYGNKLVECDLNKLENTVICSFLTLKILENFCVLTSEDLR